MNPVWIFVTGALLLWIAFAAWQWRGLRCQLFTALRQLQTAFAARSEQPVLPRTPQAVVDWLEAEEQQHSATAISPDYLIIADQIATARRAYNAAASRYNERLSHGAGHILQLLGARLYPYYNGEELAQPASRHDAPAA